MILSFLGYSVAETSDVVTVKVEGSEKGWCLLLAYIYGSCLVLPETYPIFMIIYSFNSV